ncbi:MAG: Asp23/Gls24 family envelope stress response protein [Actinomadura sp.]
MTGLDEGRTGNGEPGQEAGAMPFFPGPGGRRAAHAGEQPGRPAGPAAGPRETPPPAPRPAGTPLPAPPAAGAVPATLRGAAADITTGVEGRVTIEDEVMEKIAALAALEVAGVAALLGRPGPAAAGPAAGQAATGQAATGQAAGGGVRVVPREDRAPDGDDSGDEVTIDLAIAVEYGCVVRDVAEAVKANVARVAGVMLGTRVAAVNVHVGDVRRPARAQR